MPEELTWLPAWQIRELIAKREVSPVEVVDHFLARVEEHNPTLRAFKTLDAAAAREQASRAEAQVRNGDDLGSLHGIPISVKESIAVAGFPMKTVSGTVVPSRDALGVERLRHAGAIIVGTNTAMGTSAPPPAPPAPRVFNWDKEARNPWDPIRTPGWSSSGGAAAAAAALMPVTIGSDGGGSTRLPAAYSGVVGVHPTANAIPVVDYDEPRMPALTVSIGPLCRDALDAAMVLQAMTGPDGRDFTALPFDPPNYLAHISDGVQGMRLAWTADYGYAGMYARDISPRVIETVRTSAQGLQSLGATVETTDAIWQDFYDGYVATNYLFGVSNAAPPRPTPERWAAALDCRQYNWETTRRVLSQFDVILSPTAQLVAPTIEDWSAYWDDGTSFTHGTFAPTYTSHTHMWNWLMFPAISVPCGFVNGLPVGLQIVARPFEEDKAFRVAQAFQMAFRRNEHPLIS